MMIDLAWPVHDDLRRRSRLRALTDSAHPALLRDALLLIGAGAGAACAVTWIDFNLRVPGHAILRAALPMAMGLALAPRRLGGLLMAFGAGASVFSFHLLGWNTPGMGASTSLLLLGPLLDAALVRVTSGGRLYLAFAFAGIMANLAAFAVRGAGKWWGLDAPTKRLLADWLSVAPISYLACGLVAGLLSALVCFRSRSRPRAAAEKSA